MTSHTADSARVAIVVDPRRTGRRSASSAVAAASRSALPGARQAVGDARFLPSPVFSFALGMAGQVTFHLMDQDRITRAPSAVTTLVPSRAGPGHGDRLADMLREDAAAAADHGRTDAPRPATRVLPACSPEDQSGDPPNQSPPDRTATEHRPPGQTVTLPPARGHGVAEPAAPALRASGPDIDRARGIARELAGAGQHVSRRALRSRGVRGSNEALNALALRLSAELAIDTAGCS
jgi:hypothetical protein